MATASVTEEIVRTSVVTLALNPDEARALSSLVQHVTPSNGEDGPARHVEVVAEELRRVVRDELPPVPGNRIFSADGNVTFSAYRFSR
ncbi:hypothetical protein [Streptomyces sp. R44]|uniref:Uncharacterized protein n=1 Tax=Streptomyces sp. R44 TaxID=3238633 RepID=A0AB39T501_9ACTN